MEREQIVRADFPVVRKGWSPEAVESHLVEVAEYVAAKPATPTPAADAATERVGAVLAAAESTAAEIIEDAEAEASRIVTVARAEADQIRAAARTESEQTVEAAGREASTRVEQAQAAVEGLVAQADKLRNQVGALGRDLASNVPGLGSLETSSDELPDPAAEAPARPEPKPQRAEPEPAAEAPARKPVPRRKAAARPAAEKPAPAAAPAKPSAPSDDDLIAQLRGSAEAPLAEEPPAPAISGSETGAARLVAMNMALEGATREKIAKQIEAEFGNVEGVDALIDDVLRRANR